MISQTVYCMIFSSTYPTDILHFIFSEEEIGKQLSLFFFFKARELQVNCTFILYDYQYHHFPKTDSPAAFQSFSHYRDADILCHDYYHIQGISVNLIIVVLASNGMETQGKNKYCSLLLLFKDKANEGCFKCILFLTTVF